MDQPKPIDAHIDSDEEDFSRDWLRTDKHVRNDGFRTGLEANQEHALQFGFNAGFREALLMSLAGGQLQGALSAHLSYPARVVSELSSASGVQGQSASSDVCTQLQRLLSSNAELISSIPSLLKGNLMTSAWLQQPPASVAQPPRADKTSDLSFVNTGSAVKSLDIVPPLEESRQCTAMEHVTAASASKTSETTALSCELVCSSKSHFWSQLQQFKEEAQTFGVTSHN
ncbi:hypothetical protein BsWGS_01674 [Bradybaena similaris]